MTSNVRGSISGVTADEVASDAGLVATFYIPCDQKAVRIPGDEEPAPLLQDQFQDRLCRALGLVEQGADVWSSDLEGEEAFLVRMNPSAASPIIYDTTIIQLALNAPGGAKRGWETAREKLEESIRDAADPKSIEDTAALKGIWGYTLTYQADVDQRVSESEAFETLRPTVRRLYSPERDLYPLAQADMAGGQMWLLHTADQGDGPAAATVYVALRTSEVTLEAERDAEKAFRQVFSGQGAALLNPDLVAHKAYYLKRQYSGRKQQKYEKDLGAFKDTSRQLLTDLKGQESAGSEELVRNLTDDYGKLIEMVWDLENLRISMARQLYNYVQQLNDYGGSPTAMQDNILGRHRDRINAAGSELEMLVTEGQYALETANPVLRMAQLRTDKAQESRQVGIEAWLAAVGLALALPHLVDYEATRALLNVPLSMLFEREIPETEPFRLIVLFAQIIIVAAAARLGYRRVKGSLSKPGGLDKWAKP